MIFYIRICMHILGDFSIFDPHIFPQPLLWPTLHVLRSYLMFSCELLLLCWMRYIPSNQYVYNMSLQSIYLLS